MGKKRLSKSETFRLSDDVATWLDGWIEQSGQDRTAFFRASTHLLILMINYLGFEQKIRLVASLQSHFDPSNFEHPELSIAQLDDIATGLFNFLEFEFCNNDRRRKGLLDMIGWMCQGNEKLQEDLESLMQKWDAWDNDLTSLFTRQRNLREEAASLRQRAIKANRIRRAPDKTQDLFTFESPHSLLGTTEDAKRVVQKAAEADRRARPRTRRKKSG